MTVGAERDTKTFRCNGSGNIQCRTCIGLGCSHCYGDGFFVCVGCDRCEECDDDEYDGDDDNAAQ